MNSKQRRTLERIFTNPTPSGVPWDDIESLFRALDATITEGAGSRIRVKIGDVRASFHVPHPRRQAAQGRVRAVRAFLEDAGVKP